MIEALREATAVVRAAIAATLWGGQDPVRVLAWRVSAPPYTVDVGLAHTWQVLDRLRWYWRTASTRCYRLSQVHRCQRPTTSPCPSSATGAAWPR